MNDTRIQYKKVYFRKLCLNHLTSLIQICLAGYIAYKPLCLFVHLTKLCNGLIQPRFVACQNDRRVAFMG